MNYLLIVAGAILAIIGTWRAGYESAINYRDRLEALPAPSPPNVVIWESDIVTGYELQHASDPFKYPLINWLASRTHFKHGDTIIVEYDIFVDAVREVDKVVGELNECRADADRQGLDQR